LRGNVAKTKVKTQKTLWEKKQNHPRKNWGRENHAIQKKRAEKCDQEIPAEKITGGGVGRLQKETERKIVVINSRAVGQGLDKILKSIHPFGEKKRKREKRTLAPLRKVTDLEKANRARKRRRAKLGVTGGITVVRGYPISSKERDSKGY